MSVAIWMIGTRIKSCIVDPASHTRGAARQRSSRHASKRPDSQNGPTLTFSDGITIGAGCSVPSPLCLTGEWVSFSGSKTCFALIPVNCLARTMAQRKPGASSVELAMKRFVLGPIEDETSRISKRIQASDPPRRVNRKFAPCKPGLVPSHSAKSASGNDDKCHYHRTLIRSRRRRCRGTRNAIGSWRCGRTRECTSGLRIRKWNTGHKPASGILVKCHALRLCGSELA